MLHEGLCSTRDLKYKTKLHLIYYSHKNKEELKFKIFQIYCQPFK